MMIGVFGRLRRCVDVFVWRTSRREVVVVIWGMHSPDWMNALAANAPVWKGIPQVKAVLNRTRPGTSVPLGLRWGRRVVVIPLMENHYAECPTGYSGLLPSLNAIEILGNKARFADYVRRHGLAAWCPGNYASFEKATFPCVLKRTNLNAGRGVEIATSPDEARHFSSLELFAGHAYLIQALVPCTIQYVVHCVCVEGRIVWHVVYAYDFNRQEVMRANYLYALRRATISASMLRKLEAFVMPLAYSGPCSVDCTWDDDGGLMVFEINPRLGGSLMRPENTTDLAACLSVIIAHAV